MNGDPSEFTRVAIEVIRDETLSSDARFLCCLLLSIEHYQNIRMIRSDRLRKIAGWDEHRWQRVTKELEQDKYIRLMTLPDRAKVKKPEAEKSDPAR